MYNEERIINSCKKDIEREYDRYLKGECKFENLLNFASGMEFGIINAGIDLGGFMPLDYAYHLKKEELKMYEMRVYKKENLLVSIKRSHYFVEFYKLAVSYVADDNYDVIFANIFKDGDLLYQIKKDESGVYLIRVSDLNRIKIRYR